MMTALPARVIDKPARAVSPLSGGRRGIRHFNLSLWSLLAILTAALGVGYGAGWKLTATRWAAISHGQARLTANSVLLESLRTRIVMHNMNTADFIAMTPKVQGLFLLRLMELNWAHDDPVYLRYRAAYLAEYPLASGDARLDVPPTTTGDD